MEGAQLDVVRLSVPQGEVQEDLPPELHDPVGAENPLLLLAPVLQGQEDGVEDEVEDREGGEVPAAPGVKMCVECLGQTAHRTLTQEGGSARLREIPRDIPDREAPDAGTEREGFQDRRAGRQAIQESRGEWRRCPADLGPGEDHRPLGGAPGQVLVAIPVAGPLPGSALVVDPLQEVGHLGLQGDLKHDPGAGPDDARQRPPFREALGEQGTKFFLYGGAWWYPFRGVRFLSASGRGDQGLNVRLGRNLMPFSLLQEI